MLTLTFEKGRQEERVFCGQLQNEEDLQKFVNEVRLELQKQKEAAFPHALFVELWEETRKAWGTKNPHKRT